MSEENKAVVRKFVEEVQTKGNLDAIEELLSADFKDNSPGPGVPPTREGIRMFFTAMRSGLPDMKATIHEQIAEGDKVVTRKTLTGTHQGVLMGVPPTGKTINLEVIDIVRVANGKLVEHWHQVDAMGVMQQLGMIPTQP